MTSSGLVATDRPRLVAELQDMPAAERASAVCEAAILASWLPQDLSTKQLAQRLRGHTAEQLVLLLEGGPDSFAALPGSPAQDEENQKEKK